MKFALLCTRSKRASARHDRTLQDARRRTRRYDDRVEDWGRRPLAYPIEKLVKAHYVL